MSGVPAGMMLIFSCLPAFVFTPATSFADELEMKAALVFKLTRFISWPDETTENKDGTLTICSSVHDPINPYLDPLQGELSNGRAIDIRHIDNVEEIKAACKLLYVSKESIHNRIPALKNSPVLTISDLVGFAKKGGMIEIARRNERLRFQINLSSAVATGIKISAPLLKISTVIRDDAAEGTK